MEPDLHRTDLPDRYSIISLLGVGGMGEVYLAEDTKLGRKVAIKTLPVEFTNDKERLRRFYHEARAASSLNHPNLLTIHEIGDEKGAHFMAAEYIDGDTLRVILKRGRLKLDEALDVARQCALALTAAHGAGILHRDIKPENIMVRRDGIVKVLDFGLAKLLEDHARGMVDHEAETRALVLTDPGRVMGTPAYMSPEQARGLELDARTDIWSLGVVIYEMLAGRAPFRGETRSHTVVSILEADPSSLATFAPETPAELQRIVRKALTKDRDSRYQTSRDLMIDLKNLRRELDIQSEAQRSGLPAVSHSSSGDSPRPVKVSEDALLPPATSLTEPSPPTSDKSIGYRIAAMIAMVLLALGFGLWQYLHRQDSRPVIDSIAVMPFVNASDNSDVEYLSDGMTESLITSLSQLPNLSVKGRSSVFRYKNKDTLPQQVGKELNVKAIVSGRVVLRGNDLTLHIELVDASTETALWSADYNRPMSNLVSLQSEIAREVATKVQSRLSDTDRQTVTRTYTANADAYQCYLRGRYFWNKRTADGLNKAIQEFQKAIERDPNYALGYVGLADSYSILEQVAGFPATDTLPKARAAADRALQIDDSLSEAHTASANIYYLLWRWPEAEEEFKRAIALNPKYATAHHLFSRYLRTRRRFDEAMSEIKLAQELDPLSPIISSNGAFLYFLKNDLDTAIEQDKKIIEFDPSYWVAHSDIAWAYLKQRRYEEATLEFQKGVEASGRSSLSLGNLGNCYGVTGKRAEAMALLKELEERYTKREAIGFNIASVYAGLGGKDQAFAWLEKDFQQRSGQLQEIVWWPNFESLRTDPRYLDLVGRMGLQP